MLILYETHAAHSNYQQKHISTPKLTYTHKEKILNNQNLSAIESNAVNVHILFVDSLIVSEDY